MPPPDDSQLELGGPVTNEVTLLDYQYWPDAPEHCRTPERLLAHLEHELGSGECEAQRVTLRGRELLLLSCFCPVAGGSSASASCELEYGGTLRVLRDGGSETDYRLVGQGNLSRLCETADGRVRMIAAESDDIRVQRQASRELKQELEACVRP